MAATFGASGLGFGALTGWAIQSSDPTEESQRATAPNESGNVVESEIYDKTENVTTTYKAAAKSPAPAVPATLGAVVNGITLLGISLSTDSEDWATMTLTGHVHVDGEHGTVRTLAHGITLDTGRGFGASRFGVTGGDSVRSSECNITCEHNDVQDEVGDTVAGENYDGKVEITARLLGSGGAAPAGYDLLADGTEGSNTDYQYNTIRCIKNAPMV